MRRNSKMFRSAKSERRLEYGCGLREGQRTLLQSWAEATEMSLQLRNAPLQLILERALGSLGQGMGEGTMFKSSTNLSPAKLIPNLSF